MIRPAASAAALLVLVLAPLAASADEGDALRGPRLALVPGIGVGVRTITSAPSYVPSFVGVTTLQVDVSYEVDRLGGFARAAFLSSGDDGRWTAPVLALGASYRLFGDGEERLALVAHGGLLYERWHASEAVSGGCPIALFIPSNCKDFTQPDPNGLHNAAPPPQFVTVDTLGVLAGVRLELPVRPVFVAVGADLTATGDVSQGSPGGVFGGQITLSFAFRNHQLGNVAADRVDPARYRTRGNTPY